MGSYGSCLQIVLNFSDALIIGLWSLQCITQKINFWKMSQNWQVEHGRRGNSYTFLQFW